MKREFIKPSVGQKMIFQPRAHTGKNLKPEECEVVKVGRIYFYIKVKTNQEIQINLNDFSQEGSFSSCGECYTDLEELRQRLKFDRTMNYISNMIRYNSYTNELSLDDAITIHKLLEGK